MLQWWRQHERLSALALSQGRFVLHACSHGSGRRVAAADDLCSSRRWLLFEDLHAWLQHTGPVMRKAMCAAAGRTPTAEVAALCIELACAAAVRLNRYLLFL